MGISKPILLNLLLYSSLISTCRTFLSPSRPRRAVTPISLSKNRFNLDDLKLQVELPAIDQLRNFSLRVPDVNFSLQVPDVNVSAATDQLMVYAKPAQEFLDDKTDGWALYSADLSPETESSPLGISFLATNVAYGLVGIILTLKGDFFFGLMTEVTAIASFNYHYWQLVASRKEDVEAKEFVRLALLVDYFLAFSTIGVALVYTLTSANFPIEGLIFGALGILFLGLCWIWEKGQIYMVFHSLWHVFSAIAGYFISTSHLG